MGNHEHKNDETSPETSDDWHDLAEKVSQETDPEKLRELAQRLSDKIDQLKSKRFEPPAE